MLQNLKQSQTFHFHKKSTAILCKKNIFNWRCLLCLTDTGTCENNLWSFWNIYYNSFYVSPIRFSSGSYISSASSLFGFMVYVFLVCVHCEKLGLSSGYFWIN